MRRSKTAVAARPTERATPVHVMPPPRCNSANATHSARCVQHPRHVRNNGMGVHRDCDCDRRLIVRVLRPTRKRTLRGARRSGTARPGSGEANVHAFMMSHRFQINERRHSVQTRMGSGARPWVRAHARVHARPHRVVVRPHRAVAQMTDFRVQCSSRRGGMANESLRPDDLSQGLLCEEPRHWASSPSLHADGYPTAAPGA